MHSGAVELHAHMENAEYIIRSALFHSRGKVYIIDCGADTSTLTVAYILAEDHERLILLRNDTSVMLSENITQ